MVRLAVPGVSESVLAHPGLYRRVTLFGHDAPHPTKRGPHTQSFQHREITTVWHPVDHAHRTVIPRGTLYLWAGGPNKIGQFEEISCLFRAHGVGLLCPHASAPAHDPQHLPCEVPGHGSPHGGMIARAQSSSQSLTSLDVSGPVRGCGVESHTGMYAGLVVCDDETGQEKTQENPGVRPVSFSAVITLSAPATPVRAPRRSCHPLLWWSLWPSRVCVGPARA